MPNIQQKPAIDLFDHLADEAGIADVFVGALGAIVKVLDQKREKTQLARSPQVREDPLKQHITLQRLAHRQHVAIKADGFRGKSQVQAEPWRMGALERGSQLHLPFGVECSNFRKRPVFVEVVEDYVVVRQLLELGQEPRRKLYIIH